MHKCYVVGLGPGDLQNMTPAAAAAIEQSDVVVGYDLYVQLIAPLTQGKQVLSTPMKKEEQRCRMAVELARSGKTVAMVCSGDPGVYGMAGILIEVAAPYPEVEVEAVPGITAAVSCAAVLGAPLIHDFAVISLSDLLTPWEKIEKRLLCAAQADFVLCLYNPSSKKRADYLRRACELVLQFQPPETCCGYVRSIGREGQETHLCSLEQLKSCQVDMFTTVIIGNSQTKRIGNQLVTPRGYRLERDAKQG